MSEAKYTRGPWVISENGFISAPDNDYVTFTAMDENQCFFDNPADKNLIAAAPDLLEALQGVLRVADRATIEFDAARAAIAKALGATNAN